MTAATIALTMSLALAQPATEKVFQEWGESLAGSVWTGTDARGDKFEQRFDWALNKSFLRTTWEITGDSGEGFYGIDPATGKLVAWSFDDDGRLWTLAVTIEKAGVWTETGTGKSKTGQPNSWKAKFSRLGADTLKLEIQDNVLDGRKFPAEAITLTRKR
jgi:hypothetical protein